MSELTTTHAEQEQHSPLTAITEAEYSRAIATARRYPRSIPQFLETAKQWATLDADTAASMFYVLRRGSKKIEGPSTRLAEVVGAAYGNLRYGARIMEIGETAITAQGVAFDLERNVSVSVDVSRRITDKQGRRYDDDMIVVTSNAACSIALRNAILRIIPEAFTRTIMEAAKKSALGDAEDALRDKVEKALEHFTKLGVARETVLEHLRRKTVEEVTAGDLVELRAKAAAIGAGEETVDGAFTHGETESEATESD